MYSGKFSIAVAILLIFGTAAAHNLDHNCPEACTREMNRVCATNGKEFRIFNNPCMLDVFNCEHKFEWMQTFSLKPCLADTKSISCGKPCTREYKPVCGFNGFEYKTFPNHCVMENEHCKDHMEWKQTRMGECTTPNSAEIEIKPNCHKPCNKMYQPVCAFDGQTFKVFNNECLMEEEIECTGHNWHVANFGVCEHSNAAAIVEEKKECVVICPRILAPVCGFDGRTYKTFDNKCIMEKTGECEHHPWQLVAFTSCPEIAEIKENKMDCIKPCNKMLAPVCGTDGFEYKTFPNKCVMENQHCLDNHKWDVAPFSMCNAPQEQKKDCPLICPLIYAPICGFNGFSYHTFDNDCQLNAYNCFNNEHFIANFHGVCPQTQELKEVTAVKPKKECLKACPLIYAPICAFNGLTQHTFGNECELEVYNCMNNEHFITNFHGECPVTQEVKEVTAEKPNKECLKACPLIYAPICGFNGLTQHTFANDCELEVYNCMTKEHFIAKFHGECPVTQEIKEVASVKPKKECLKACPLIYAPICAFNGLAQHTFANDCELEVYNCMNNEHFISSFHGECQENIATFEAEEPKKDCPMICPANYAPICAFDGKTHHTFSNECELVSYNCLNHGHFIANFNGECESKYDDEAEGVFACPYNLDPQCGFDGYSYRVFDNQCMMDGYNKVHRSVHFNHVDLSFCKNLL